MVIKRSLNNNMYIDLQRNINQYINNGSDVYSCLLDASKDFDRVHYGKPLKIVLSKKLHILIIRLTLDSYLRQYVRVMWDSCKSEYFKVYNGILQGGVISCHYLTCILTIYLYN